MRLMLGGNACWDRIDGSLRVAHAVRAKARR